MSDSNGRLLILSGPSCVGKSPLVKALDQHAPDLAGRIRPLVLYNDRPPRPGERDGEDYHFRTRAEIESLRGEDRYIVMEVRSDLQAIDMEELTSQLADGDVLFEGNPFVGTRLLEETRLAEVTRLSVFLAPLAREEIHAAENASGVDVDQLITDCMRRKLLRRTRRQKGCLALPDLEEIETRCRSAPRELRMAWRFDHVLPNHDGEDHENWWAFPLPLGEARRALLAFAQLLREEPCPLAETWEKELLPRAD